MEGSRMDWDAVGAVGEAVGAVGVIITLLYLASTVRQNTRTEKASSRQTILDNFYGNAWETARDMGLRHVVLAGLNRYSELSAEDKASFDLLQLRYMGNLHNALLLKNAGSLDQESFDLIANAFIGGILTQGGRDWWNLALKGAEISPSVREYVQERLSAGSDLPPSWTDVHEHFRQV
jgi:hypothetical protein